MLETLDPVATQDTPATKYDVYVDLGTLKLAPTGLKGAEHSVTLAGPIDDRWRECFQIVQAESPEYSRFWLDEATATVEFPQTPKDGPSEIINALETLDSLIARANERC